MPPPPLPDALVEFLLAPNPAVIATLRPGGSPHTVATWYVWDDGRLLVNMDEARTRLNHLREDPRVAITVLGRDDWSRHVSMTGRVVSLEPDPDLADIDRLARHYFGDRFPHRDRGRVSAWIEVESWHAWAGAEPWTAA
jgi:PPOX class probable F420-dependent enzyme